MNSPSICTPIELQVADQDWFTGLLNTLHRVSPGQSQIPD